MPEVTVVLPVHNGANYLEESIGSVLAQDFRDFELHILDDDSTDDTPQIAQSTGDPRVRYSRNLQRFGLFKTLNRSFIEATSPWVRIWAHDDRMVPHGMRTFIEFARTHPQAGMVYCDFRQLAACGRPTGADFAHREQRRRTPELAPSRLSALLFLVYGCLPGNVSTVMLRREAWQRVGGFQEGRQQAPDYEMWVRISREYDVGFIQEKLVELRDHPLQLGKQGGKQLTTVEEELPVFGQLLQRLHGVVSEEEFRWFWRERRGRQYIHWIARAMLRGDLRAAGRGWRSVKRYGQPWQQAWSWLTSLNGRLFRLDRERFFDSKAPFCR